MKNNQSLKLPTAPVTPRQSAKNGSELEQLLRALPSANVKYKGFSKAEMQVRIPAQLTEKIKLIVDSLAIVDESSTFRADDLVSYLLTEFILSHPDGIKSLLKAASTKTLKSLAQSNLAFDVFFQLNNPTQS